MLVYLVIPKYFTVPNLSLDPALDNLEIYLRRLGSSIGSQNGSLEQNLMTTSYYLSDNYWSNKTLLGPTILNLFLNIEVS